MNQFPQNENELLRSEIRVAHEAADITAQLVIKQFEETYQILQKLEMANDYLGALHQTTLSLVGRLDTMDLLQTIVARAGALIGAQHGYIYLLTADKTEMEMRVGLGAHTQRVGLRIKPGLGLAGRVWQTRQSFYVEDYMNWEGRKRDPSMPDFRGMIGVPLKSGEEVVGVIGLAYGDQQRKIGNTEVEVLSRFAALASIALENARLYATLQDSDEYHRLILDLSPEPIMVYDAQGRVRSVNRAFMQVFGWWPSELADVTAEFVPLDKQAELREYTLLGIKEGQVQDVETKRRTKDGRLLDVQISATFMKGENNRVTQIIVILRDITERKRMEEELRQARDAAESANRAKSAFLASMSHEIRTPMNAVIGLTSLLLDTPLTDEQRDYIETVRNSGDALLTIINDILDFSKIESGKMDLECLPLDLRDCVESALDLLASRAHEKSLELLAIVDDAVPSAIKGDITRLRQILINLLGNSIKFTEKGEVTLKVSVEEGKQTKGESPASLSTCILRFSVRDTGIGLDEAGISRLFKSFSQVDASTTRKFGGTGLGLVVSKRLAEMMGGTMWVESKGLGHGSTFFFTIQVESAPPIARVLTSPEQMRGKRILVVDDNANNRLILTKQLQSWQMTSAAVESGFEALSLLERGEKFDLAILDMQMPEMDGVMLAEKIRKLVPVKQLPMVMLTSLGRREPGWEKLFAAFLSKPVKSSQLYNVLVETLAKDMIGRAAPARHSAAESLYDPTVGERNPLRVLLVEDNAVNQKLARRMLERFGYRADVAANGLEALEALDRQPYDLVFMDVQMPEMDGFEATRQIRSLLCATRQPRIVAMTANAMQGDREECLTAGMDDYVSKPIGVNELRSALESAAIWVGDHGERN
jgi:PAS domain S-box-containing protein